MSTYSAMPKEFKKEWVMFDAEGVVLGRLASHVAKVLRGKHKATYTPNADCGDHVVIINADKVKLTGRKKGKKVYYRHTGYAGGIKETTAEKILGGEHPERVMEKAIERMMPKDSPLARAQVKHLHIYNGTEHPHAGQSPKKIDFAAMNVKNAR